MTSYVTPKKGVEFICYVGLFSQANTKILQANPTLAAGDAKVSIDGGAFANLATLPAVTPASGKSVKVTLSTSEMNGDNITVVLSDASGDEWCDLIINIQTSARQVDDLAFPTTSGRSLDVSATGEAGADVVLWAGVAPNPLIGGRVDAILGAFLIDESRVDGSCTEAGETKSFTTNLTETETDYYAGWVFMFTDAGTNRAVPRVVRSYNGTTKEITLVTDLPATTTNGHAFALIALTTGAELTDGSMALNMSYTSSAVLDAEQAGFLTAGTIGESINEAATNSADIQSRLPAALVSGKMDSDVAAVAGSTGAATNARQTFLSVVAAAAVSGTLSTTQMSTNLTEATDDHYNGRLITWVTGNLAGQQTDITDYDGTSKVLTFTAITEAPSAGDGFVIT